MEVHAGKLDVTIGKLSAERTIRPEILDHSPPGEVSQSLDDLARINRLLGGHEVLRKTLRRLFPAGEGFTMLDVGAASGDMGKVVRAAYPGSRVTSLDYRLHHMRRAGEPRIAGDAFALPIRKASYDVVHSSLFLHHFTNEQVVELLTSFGRIARKYVVMTDIERHFLTRHFVRATRWILGWHPITVHDSTPSSDAAFTAGELRRLASAAGLEEIEVIRFRPAFRIALVARPPRDE